MKEFDGLHVYFIKQPSKSQYGRSAISRLPQSGSAGRPVAVISIGPQGVRVEPVVDVTKLGLTALMTIGSLLMLFARMHRMSRG